MINPCATFFSFTSKDKNSRNVRNFLKTLHDHTWYVVLDDDKKEAAWQQKVSVVVLVSVPIFTTSLFLTTKENFLDTKNVPKM